MGLDILAISKANRVPCRCKTDDEISACDEFHITVGSVPWKKDALKPGCYVRQKGGREFGFRAGTAAGYGEWRQDLCLFALGVLPDDVWDHPRRYRGQPFFELINFPDSMGHGIGPAISAKLHTDFAAFAAKAKKHYLLEARDGKVVPQPTTKSSSRKKIHPNRASEAGAFALAEQIGGELVSPSGRQWMWEVYRDFRRAFKLASDDGLVLFC